MKNIFHLRFVESTSWGCTEDNFIQQVYIFVTKWLHLEIATDRPNSLFRVVSSFPERRKTFRNPPTKSVDPRTNPTSGVVTSKGSEVPKSTIGSRAALRRRPKRPWPDTVLQHQSFPAAGKASTEILISRSLICLSEKIQRFFYCQFSRSFVIFSIRSETVLYSKVLICSFFRSDFPDFRCIAPRFQYFDHKFKGSSIVKKVLGFACF